MLRTRDGASAASEYAARAPQSCPIASNVSMPSPSASASASLARATLRPSRTASATNVLGPYPRRYGAIVRYPSACRCGAISRHARTSSGHPCSKKIGRPSRGPRSSYAIRTVGVSKNAREGACDSMRVSPRSRSRSHPAFRSATRARSVGGSAGRERGDLRARADASPTGMPRDTASARDAASNRLGPKHRDVETETRASRRGGARKDVSHTCAIGRSAAVSAVV